MAVIKRARIYAASLWQPGEVTYTHGQNQVWCINAGNELAFWVLLSVGEIRLSVYAEKNLTRESMFLAPE